MTAAQKPTLQGGQIHITIVTPDNVDVSEEYNEQKRVIALTLHATASLGSCQSHPSKSDAAARDRAANGSEQSDAEADAPLFTCTGP